MLNPWKIKNTEDKNFQKYLRYFLVSLFLFFIITGYVQNLNEYRLYSAINRGDLEYVVKIIEKEPEIVNSFIGWTRVRYTPLQFAVTNNNLEICKILLENGAKVGHAGNERARPITIAFDNNNMDIAKLLLQYGAGDDLGFWDCKNLRDLSIDNNNEKIYNLVRKYCEPSSKNVK